MSDEATPRVDGRSKEARARKAAAQPVADTSALDAAKSELAAEAAKTQAARDSAAASAELARLRAENAALKAQNAAQAPASTDRPSAKVGYTGFVRALVRCHHGALREEGDEWYVEGVKLWTDDPFEPIRGQSTPESRATGYGPDDTDAPLRIDFRTRVTISQVYNPAPQQAHLSGI